MAYEFKGHDWAELAECWGITVEEQPFMVYVGGKEEPEEMGKLPEKIVISKTINRMNMTFEIDDEEEILAEKIKRRIWDNVDHQTGNFKDEQMREDIHRFLKALIGESKQIDYCYPVYEGLLKLESDYTLAKWITNNLEFLWT